MIMGNQPDEVTCEVCGKREAQTWYDRMKDYMDFIPIALCHKCKDLRISEEIIEHMEKLNSETEQWKVKHWAEHIRILGELL